MPTPAQLVETFFKEKTFRSKKYLDFIKRQPCFICGNTPVDSHHETMSGKGTGLKGPDNQTLPLCYHHHTERHNMGRESFYSRYGYYNDLWKTWVMIYQSRYEEIHGKIK